MLGLLRRAEQVKTKRQECGASAIDEECKVADAHEAFDGPPPAIWLYLLHHTPRLRFLNPLLNTGYFANRKYLLETLRMADRSYTSVTPHRSWATVKIIPPLRQNIKTKDLCNCYSSCYFFLDFSLSLSVISVAALACRIRQPTTSSLTGLESCPRGRTFHFWCRASL